MLLQALGSLVEQHCIKCVEIGEGEKVIEVEGLDVSKEVEEEREGFIRQEFRILQ